MKTIVFVGPTCSVESARVLLDASYRPPAAQGDVYRAALEGPWGIGLIDGYFERVPAVWHKEILWAMSRGVRVFGASSMGALRAAELASYGMVAVGEIANAFCRGSLTDDDEVAVLHASAAEGYRSISDAMVDIRATLAAAASAGVIAYATAEALVALAKATHYSERSYGRLMRDACSRAIAREELERLQAWLPENRVRLKERDARELLRHMAQAQIAEPGPMQAEFAFQHTDAFERAITRSETPQRRAANLELLEELRLNPSQYEALANRALAQVLARDTSAQNGFEIDDSRLATAAAEFRRARGLYETADMREWLARRGLDADALSELLRDELRVTTARAALHDELEQQLIGVLRKSDDYDALSSRALEKSALLERHGYTDPQLSQTAMTEHELLVWFYREAAPELLHRLDYRDVYACIRAVVREYLYQRLERASATASSTTHTQETT